MHRPNFTTKAVSSRQPRWEGQRYFPPRYPMDSQQRAALLTARLCPAAAPGAPSQAALTTAQQQLRLISPACLNLGCQGSLVGGCLLYFFKKKKKMIFFFLSVSHTMTNPETKGEECCQCETLKLQYLFAMRF